MERFFEVFYFSRRYHIAEMADEKKKRTVVAPWQSDNALIKILNEYATPRRLCRDITPLAVSLLGYRGQGQALKEVSVPSAAAR